MGAMSITVHEQVEMLPGILKTIRSEIAKAKRKAVKEEKQRAKEAEATTTG